MIIFISDLDLRGSGYMNIAIALCNQMVDHGFDVTVLGIGYDGGEHNFPFSIIPVETGKTFQHIHAMLQNLRSLSAAGQFPQIQGVVTALDIPLQEHVLKFPRENIPYMGVFPIESGPLCPTWAASLAQMDERLVISKYGEKQIKDAGLSCTYLPIGIDTESWRLPDDDERTALRNALGFDDDDFVVLTVADNQERKNLAAAAMMMQELKDDIPIKWNLVTRVDARVGWKLGDPPFDLGAMFTTYERGLSFDRLWTLYAAADAFLLTSKAEGLCMPIVEAMAVGVPVAATDCTAVPEHMALDNPESGLFGGQKYRGFPIDVEYIAIDPWGNSERNFVSVDDGVKQLKNIYKLIQKGKIKNYTEPARAYAESRTWDKAGEVVAKQLRRMIAKKAPIKAGQNPPTIPQVVPRMGGQE